MTFTKWFDTFLQEKGIDTEQYIDVYGPSGVNTMPLSVVTDQIKITSSDEQRAIKDMIVRIDFHNGDVVHYFKHLAGAIAI